ncbi:MAG: glutamate racemase [Comamonas sp.]
MPTPLAPLPLPDSPERPAPIGVFDSGIGGLSVLQALRAALPHEDFVYFSDGAHAPYGERGDDFVLARSTAVARQLAESHGIKALVVACNTATAAAIEDLRARHPALPLVGVEPALKPAVAASRTRRVGVAATQGTLRSEKLQRLLASLAGQADFVLQPFTGLALALERSVAVDARDPDALAASAREIDALIRQNLADMGPFGAAPGQIDTLVLGCTHYPFAHQRFQALAGGQTLLLETGAPVARQTQRLLAAQGLLQPDTRHAGTVVLASSGPLHVVQTAARRWLGLDAAQLPQVLHAAPAA